MMNMVNGIMNNPPHNEAYKRPTGPRITLNNNAPATLLYGVMGFPFLVDRTSGNIISPGSVPKDFIEAKNEEIEDKFLQI